MTSSDAKEAARDAASRPAFRLLARGGFAANGIVHVLIGAIALIVAVGGEGKTDQSGALTLIAGIPAGFLVLWILAAALWALAVWYAIDGFLARGTTRVKWGGRVSSWARGVVYAAIGAVAAIVAVGGRPDADASAQGASDALLHTPGGVLVLLAIALTVGITGGTFFFIGVARRYRTQLLMPPGALGTVVDVTGIAGYVAKGVSLLLVGVLLLLAGVTSQPRAAGGVDAAIAALHDLPSGGWLVAAIGAGLVLFGLYCFFRARFAKL